MIYSGHQPKTFWRNLFVIEDFSMSDSNIVDYIESIQGPGGHVCGKSSETD